MTDLYLYQTVHVARGRALHVAEHAAVLDAASREWFGRPYTPAAATLAARIEALAAAERYPTGVSGFVRIELTEEGLDLSYEKFPEGVLRYELRMNREYIHTLEKRYKTKDAIEFLQTAVDEAMPLLFTKFYDTFPPDQYWRLEELLKKIWDSPYPEHLKRKMIDIAELTSECSGVDEAFQKLGSSKDERKQLLQKFRELGLSPVPLRKNFSAEWIPAPTYLLYQFAKGEAEIVYIPYVRIK